MRPPWLGVYPRAVLRAAGLHVAIAGLAGLILFAVVDFVEIGNLARAEAESGDILLLILVNVPTTLRTVLPVAAPIGAATALGALLRRRELVAFFAAGASPGAVLAPLGLLGLALAALHVLNVELLVSSSRPMVVELRHELGLGGSRQDGLGEQRSWFKGRDHLYRVESVMDEGGRRLAQVLILTVKDGQLTRRIDAARLEHQDSTWHGEHVVSRRIAPGRLETESLESSALDLAEDPEDFVRAIAAPSRLRYPRLSETAKARARLGQPDEAHQLELHRRHVAPVFLLALVLAAGAGALRLGRRQSFAEALLAGAALGFGGWVSWETAGLFGVTRALDPRLAPYLPAALALAAALCLLLAARRRGVADRVPGIRLTPFPD